VLTRGPRSECSSREDVSAVIHGQTLTFTNSELEKFTIAFNPRKDGSFSEIHVDEGGGIVEISGRVIAASIEADVINLPCHHHWHLKKESGSK
jgi:hypothetical protein